MYSESQTYPNISRLFPLLILMILPVISSGQEEGDTTQFYSLLAAPDAQTSINYALLTSSAKGDTTQISWLLRYGAEIDTHTPDNITPLFYAIANNKLPATRMLLENGADPNIKTSLMETPLLVAVKNGNLEIAELLIRDSADVNFADRYGATPLHYAAVYGNFYMADLLIYYDAIIRKRSNDGTTPLMAATWGGNADIADLLLQKGADAEEKDYSGFTPFLVAAQNGDTLMMDLLLKYGANIYEVNKYKFDALDICVKMNTRDAINYLLRKGNKWGENNGNAVNPLAVASSYRRTDIVPILRQSNISGKTKRGFDEVSVTASTRFSLHDFYTGLSVTLTEPVHNLGVYAGIDFKPGYTRVLKKESEYIYYQYYDKGAVAYAGVFKNFRLTDRPLRGNWIITCSIAGGYSFGNKLKGTNINPGDGFRFFPSAGVKWMKGKFTFRSSLDYARTNFYKVGPIWLRTGISWSFFLNNAVSPGKMIRWY